MTDPVLLTHHRKMLEASAISAEVIAARGYRSVTTKAEAGRLGFAQSQRLVPALGIPLWSVAGENGSYQLRPDEPRHRDGKPVKYETAAGARMQLDVPPTVRERLGDPSVPVIFTEGVKKADAAATIGLCAVALIGVWNWRGTNERGGKTVLADFESIHLKGRTTPIAFDSDAMVKPAVYAALDRFGAFLKSRGAEVTYIYLPSGERGEKVGLDDYLAAGHGVDELLSLAVAGLRRSPGADRSGAGGPYAVRDGAICHRKRERDGDVWTPLCNFSARVVEEIVADDGASERTELLIEGTDDRGRPFSGARVPLARFGAMDWPVAQWGLRAVVNAGFGNRDRLREAIQRLSPDVPRRREYRHPGWRQLPGHGWAYLHAGGAIGKDGAVPDVDVALTGAAVRLELPDPPEGDALRSAVCACLDFWAVAPDAVTSPLLGFGFRAPLNELAYADLAGFVVGPTGVHKSELAALVMQLFGGGFDRLHLPAQWSSTPNALERVAFDLKDAPVVIDDFAPSGSTHDIARYHATADRVLRGAGNAAGRGRMAADGRARPDLPPRGLVIGTGEDVPKGHSARARAVIVEVAPGAVDLTRLTACQEDAREGVYAAATAGYVRWLAGNFEALRATLPGRLAELRRLTGSSGAHARTPDAIANLGLGWHLWLDFAASAGALTEDEAEAAWQRAWGALVALAAEQPTHQGTEAPARRFLDLLAAAIESGQAHVAGPDGGAPPAPMAWGWQAVTVGGVGYEREDWRAGGTLVGWLDGDDLYVQLDAAYAAAQRVGHGTGSNLTVQPKTLAKRLNEAGLLRSAERGRGKLTVRRTFAGARRDYLHLAASALSPEESAQPAQSSQSRGDPAPARREPDDRGPIPRAESRNLPQESAHESSPEPAQLAVRWPGGPVGPVLPAEATVNFGGSVASTFPPLDCVAPATCTKLGPCDRLDAGGPCRIG